MALPAGTARHEVAALSFARLFLPELFARSLLPASGLCWPDLCTPRIHFVHHAFVLDITCLFCTSAKLFLPGVNTACLQPPGYREPLKPCCIQGAADLVRKMKNRGPESINSFLHDHMYFFFLASTRDQTPFLNQYPHQWTLLPSLGLWMLST